MNVTGEGTDAVVRQDMLLDVLLRMKRDLSDLQIDARHRNALTERIDALTRTVTASQLLADAAFDVLNRIAVGVALVDADAAVIWSNRYVDDIVAQDDGLTISAGRLRAHEPAQSNALARLIENAHRRPRAGSDTAPTVLAIDRQRQRQPFLVAAFPLSREPSSSGDKHDIVAVFVADPVRQVALPARELEVLFGLTPAESQVAALLAGGDRLDLAAEKLGVTTGTARTHLKHIFDKTGTGRQSELSMLLQALHARVDWT